MGSRLLLLNQITNTEKDKKESDTTSTSKRQRNIKLQIEGEGPLRVVYEQTTNIEAMKMKSSNHHRVRFAPNCQVIVVLDRTKGIEDQLWYSGDEVDHFKLYSTLYADEVKKSLSDGTFCGDLDDILGLEKCLFKKSYYGRRRLFMSAVLEEQAWQRLSKEMRRRRGLTSNAGSQIADNSMVRLADIAEKYSRWATERASVSALALESDLTEECDDDESQLKEDMQVA